MKQSMILKRVLKYVGRYKCFVFLSLIFAVVSTVLSLYIPIVIGQAIDHIVSVGNVDMDRDRGMCCSECDFGVSDEAL